MLSTEKTRRITVAMFFSAMGGEAVQSQCQTAQLVGPFPHQYQSIGRSISASDDIALFGAYSDDGVAVGTGAVYLWQRGPTGWEYRQTLAADDGRLGEFFGWSVACSENRLALGAPHERSAGWESGAAYVFDLAADRSTWIQTAKLTAVDADEYDRFGQSVAVDGDRIAVGAYHDEGGGSVYIFERTAEGAWAQVAKLHAIGGGGELGYSLALEGDTVVAGAPNDWVDGNYSGAAYVFERASTGIWWQTGQLHPADGRPFSGFAYSVAVDAGTVFVGALEAHGASQWSGAVYVFEKEVTGQWVERQKIIAAVSEPSDNFGCSLAIQGNLLIVGALGVNTMDWHTGATYLFEYDAQKGWFETARLTQSDAAYRDFFGSAVAIAGQDALIGAFEDDIDGINEAGSVYVFALGPDTDNDGQPDPCQCVADLDDSGAIGLADLALVLQYFGLAAGATRPTGDVDSDSDVDLADLARLLAVFGSGCS